MRIEAVVVALVPARHAIRRLVEREPLAAIRSPFDRIRPAVVAEPR
jgi:hypothetical protein